jgi:capsid protein
MFEVTSDDYGFVLDQKMEPGMLMKLYPGEEVIFSNPKSSGAEFDPFVITLCRRIGAAVGLAWMTILRDRTKANYSSARADMLDDQDTYDVTQAWYIEEHLAKERFMVLKDLRDYRWDTNLSDCSDEDLMNAIWTPPGKEWIDPLKENQAIEVMLRHNMTTLRDELASRGFDYEEVLEQIAVEKELMEKLGLTPKEVLPAPEAKQPSKPDDKDEDGLGTDGEIEKEVTTEKSYHAS